MIVVLLPLLSLLSCIYMHIVYIYSGGLVRSTVGRRQFREQLQRIRRARGAEPKRESLRRRIGWQGCKARRMAMKNDGFGMVWS